MTQPQAAPAQRPKFDNKGQYSRTSILRYEKIFGEHYISTGGHETTLDLCRRLAGSLHPGVRVLDVGSGIGGAAFHLARAFGAKRIVHPATPFLYLQAPGGQVFRIVGHDDQKGS